MQLCSSSELDPSAEPTVAGTMVIICDMIDREFGLTFVGISLFRNFELYYSINLNGSSTRKYPHSRLESFFEFRSMLNRLT